MKHDNNGLVFVWLLNIAIAISLIIFPLLLAVVGGDIGDHGMGDNGVLPGLVAGFMLGVVIAICLGGVLGKLQQPGTYAMASVVLILIALVELIIILLYVPS